MGDMADDFLDGVLDHDDEINSYCMGQMDVSEAYDRGIVDEYGALYRTVQNKTCRRCGESGLYWGKLDGKFRLFKDGLIHQCPVRHKTCRCCGEGGLYWGKLDGKFRLFKNGSIHQCPVRPLRREKKSSWRK